MDLKELIIPVNTNVKETESIRHAVELFHQQRLNALPVVDDGGQLVGVFTKSNICEIVLSETSLDLPVSRAMVRNPISHRRCDWTENFNWVEMFTKVPNCPVGQVVVLDDNDRPIGLITKSNLLSTLIREAESLTQNMASMLNATEYGVIAVNSQGYITLFNRVATEITGYDSPDALGRPVNELIPWLQLDQVLSSGESFERLRLEVGERVVLVNGRPVQSHAGPLGAIAVLHDLTNLKRTVGELDTIRQINRTLDTVLEMAYDGILVCNENGNISLVNQSMCELLQQRAPDIIGRHVSEVFENTRLHVVAENGVPEYNNVELIHGARYVVSCLPIIKDGRSVGAVGKVEFHGLGELRTLVKQFEAAERTFDTHRDELQLSKGARYTFEHIISACPDVDRAKRDARRAALSDLPVLIIGPSGTGKELFTHSIHNAGPRRSAPFIKVNCAAVPAELLESEFFGYEAGAFTGAKSHGKPGKFELANGGTLFLDEIGDMSLSLQSKLLRVLQDGELERVGSTRPVRVNVHVIAATNRDLDVMVKTGQFRLDLYYRLNVITIKIPALMERREDIPVLVEYFIAKFQREVGSRAAGVTSVAAKALQGYEWPGNVRELENVIRRAMVLLDGDLIDVQHLPEYIFHHSFAAPEPTSLPASQRFLETEIYSRERELITDALATAGNNRKQAAQMLGISRATLYEKMHRLGMPTKK